MTDFLKQVGFEEEKIKGRVSTKILRILVDGEMIGFVCPLYKEDADFIIRQVYMKLPDYEEDNADILLIHDSMYEQEVMMCCYTFLRKKTAQFRFGPVFWRQDLVTSTGVKI